MDRETKDFILDAIDHHGINSLLVNERVTEDETAFVLYLRDQLTRILYLIDNHGFDALLLNEAKVEEPVAVLAGHLREQLHQIAEDIYEIA